MVPEGNELSEQLRRAQEEIARLRRENERLRDQLFGAPGAVAESRAEPSLFPAQSLPRLHAHSASQDKIHLFRTLFRGREDVYAERWVDARTGKPGYAPARGRAVARSDERRSSKCLPLTDSVVRDHLVGRRVVGVYPLLHGDTCWFLACDFDGHGWFVDAAAYRSACAGHGVPAYLERSRSGAGGHVWIFFDAPVPAADARRLGTALLRVTMEARAELDLASYDRFFPNQDFLPKGGFGNLIALPLQGEVRPAGNSLFLDDGLEPAADPWAFLSGADRVSPAALAAALERVPSLEVGPRWGLQLGLALHVGPERGNRSRGQNESGPRTAVAIQLRAVVGGGISIERSGIPARLLAALKHMASIHNPEFHRRQKMRLSTFRVPRLVRGYQEDLTHLHLPRGLLDPLRALATQLGFTLELEDRRVAGSDTALHFQGQLRPEQVPAVAALLANDVGVLVAPPGSGKTVMACAVIASRSVPTLVLVHRKAILAQWREQLARFLGLAPDEIGQLGGGRRRRRGRVDLAMLQTVARRQEPGAVLGDYGLVIADECHHVPAVSFERVLRQASARFVLGLTATPWRRDGLEDLIQFQCGPIRHELGSGKARRGSFRRELIVRRTAFRIADEDLGPDRFPAGGVPVHTTAGGLGLSIQEVFRLLVADRDRTAVICDDVTRALEQGRHCLILSQWRRHCAAIHERLTGTGREVELLDGSLSAKEARAAMARVRDWPADRPADRPLAVVATGQYLGEGFDCPSIDTLFLAFPIAFKGRVVQYAGRLLREAQDKSIVRIFDYVDGDVSVLRRMHAKRVTTYRALGFVEVSFDYTNRP